MQRINCKYCNKKFNTIPSRLKIGKGKFCSKKCYTNNKRRRTIIKCITCFKDFEIKSIRINTAKYCSLKCYIKKGKNNPYWMKKHSNKIKKKMKYSWNLLKNNGYKPNNYQNIYKACIICKNKFKIIKSNLKTRYCCTMKCLNIYRTIYLRGNRGGNWIDGRSYLPYPSSFNKLLKKEIRERDKNKCQNCGSLEKLSVHHIDYDKNNCLKTNLITVCFSCNSKANGHREYWLNYYKNKLCLNL